jgi:hypothetical protein
MIRGAPSTQGREEEHIQDTMECLKERGRLKGLRADMIILKRSQTKIPECGLDLSGSR